MPTPTDHALATVEVLCPTDDEAARIGSSAVAQGLAAAAHRLPVAATYRMNDDVQHTHETLLRMTTTTEAVAALVTHVTVEHSRSRPQITVTGTTAPVEQWVQAAVLAPTGNSTRSRVCYLTIQVRDLESQTQFWTQALHGERIDVSAGSSHRYAKIRLPDTGIRLLLQQVADLAPVGRTHLDIETENPAAERDRLVALGARQQRTHHENGFTWYVLTDPEGNEMCVLQPRHPQLLRNTSTTTPQQADTPPAS